MINTNRMSCLRRSDDIRGVDVSYTLLCLSRGFLRL